MEQRPSIRTPRTVLEILGPDDAQLMLAYYVANHAHLAPWEPLRSDDFLTLGNWQATLAASVESFHNGSAFKFAALQPDRSEVVGVCNFTNVAYGPFMACSLGFSIAVRHAGQGMMREVLEAAIEYVFQEVGLHRVMAAYIPSNYRSAALLARLGFEREGYARKYLQIAGRWRDHVLVAKINESTENVRPGGPSR